MKLQSFSDTASGAMGISMLHAKLYIFNTKIAMINISNMLTVFSYGLFSFNLNPWSLAQFFIHFSIFENIIISKILCQISFNLELKVLLC